MQEQPRVGFGVLRRTLFVTALAGTALLLGAAPGWAHGRHHHHYYRARIAIAAGATDPAKDAALIADGESGRILYARNATAERHPASLTKLMTLYLLFDALKRGDVTMQTLLPVSQHAASQRPTNLHLYAGETIPVETAIKAIVVRSANDVAVAIAEGLGGTEGHFAELMTAKARALGMRDTFYHNASGLPDPLQITTASDLLVLARHLAYDFPQYFPYFATPYFSFHGVNYVTHDNLIGRYDGADGMKTGYTVASGFNLVSSVVRGNMQVIGVVMGGRTAHRRDMEMEHLLDEAFGRIAANPTLVAHAGVPWRNVAFAAPPAQIASLDVAPGPGDDEDAAETGDAGDDDANVIAPPPPPSPNTAAIAQAAPPATTIPVQVVPQRAAVAPPKPAAPQKPVHVANAPHPRPKPEEVQIAAADLPKPKPTLVAAATPAPRPHLRAETGEGDIGDAGVPAMTGSRAWTIQIGAFADPNQARGQLASYAEKSMDILGQAARIVLPFTAVNGQTLYRARFGPFIEREAREVCSRLTQRGQTCFTVMASSR